MTQPSIHEIAKALSDELRVKILTEMSTKPPMRHTDLLNYIGLDAGESNKLSYHLGILMEAELVSKQNLVYTLTEKGREVLEDLSVTINDWEELAYRDDLKTLSGLEAASLLWFDQKYYGGVSWVFVGLLLFFYTRTIFFLLI
ncbi:MAG: helix-turn-helix domain-containing protein, partial [Candidatus Bathyarchaeota archaeon]|nr:helix-turn-helix domain-containing protein [Candidatus Bathyarchaeota archaeon]